MRNYSNYCYFILVFLIWINYYSMYFVSSFFIFTNFVDSRWILCIVLLEIFKFLSSNLKKNTFLRILHTCLSSPLLALLDHKYCNTSWFLALQVLNYRCSFLQYCAVLVICGRWGIFHHMTCSIDFDVLFLIIFSTKSNSKYKKHS